MKTNCDRIREMNDTELADFLTKIAPEIPCMKCSYGIKKTGFVPECGAPGDFLCVKEYAAALMQDWLTDKENIDEIKAEVGV